MKNIAKALLDIQKNLDSIHKGRKGYGYTYADLPAVMNACVDALNEAGVVLVQSPFQATGNVAGIVTRLIHADSGEEVTSEITVPWSVVVNDKGKANMTDAQAHGSAMTYARRYALVAMLGVVTDDDDGASAGTRKTQIVYNESQIELFRLALNQATSLSELKDAWGQIVASKYEKAGDLEKLKDARKVELA